MKTRFVLMVIAAMLSVSLNGQQKWTLKTNIGVASGSSVIDGYYFSFEVGIPVIKSLKLSPTFSYADMLPNTFFFNGWNASNPFPDVSVPTGGPRKETEYGDNLGSVSLLVTFLPLELFNSEKLKKHEVTIGAGVSLNSYTMVSSHYELQGDDFELISFSVKSNKAIEPYYCKLGYSYSFRQNLLLGFSAGINGFDGEAELLAGIQFGVKF